MDMSLIINDPNIDLLHPPHLNTNLFQKTKPHAFAVEIHEFNICSQDPNLELMKNTNNIMTLMSQSDDEHDTTICTTELNTLHHNLRPIHVFVFRYLIKIFINIQMYGRIATQPCTIQFCI